MKGSIRRITELFDGNSKHLLIPVYQRNYDWKLKHCARLFDDLVDIIRQDRETHFFGAIVGHPEDSFTTVVIDGGATNKSFVLELLQQPEVVGPDSLNGPAARRAALHALLHAGVGDH